MLFGLPYYLILVIPLAGSLFVPVVGRFSEKLRDWTPAILMGITMVLCWSLLMDLGTTDMPHYEWINIPNPLDPSKMLLDIPFEMLLDPLSIFMAILSSSLCFLIFVYSTEYMAHEEDRNRFHFFMLAFGGGMLTLVLSNNLLIAFIGWEIMGFCSYALIGFWNDKRNKPEEDPLGYEQTNPLLQFETEGEQNTHSGTKAFIVTRVGDAFMLGGVLLIYIFSESFLFTDLANPDNGWWSLMAASGLLLPALILIFAGAIGKSGQAPLQVWLPEAMAGPTAVSALIHAATMVKAGVYMSARFLVTIVDTTTIPSTDHAVGFVPLQSSFGIEMVITFFVIVAVVGAITAFMTATMGTVSNELKQVLAFSTLSQLGYMILAIGTSGILALDGHYEHPYLSGVLHVVAHGAFKALLFLAAGGVIHSVHTKYMSKMGGLKGYMKWTYRVMLVGVLALAGIPPFSGFWSKDSIIEYTYELATHSIVGVFLFLLAVGAAAITIFYSVRLMGMVFHGPRPEPEHHDDEHHDDNHHSDPHDPGKAMMVPLYILAGFTIIAFLIFPFIQQIAIHDTHTWAEILTEMIMVKITMPGLIPFGITVFALLLGGIPAYLMYIKGADTPNTRIPEKGALRKLYTFLLHRWYINESYYWFVNKFLNFADLWRRTVDEPIIDGIDYKSADAAIVISTKVRAFDDNVIDGFAEGISTHAVEASEVSQRSQTGRINDYVGVVIFGIGLLIIIALLTWGVI
ncbi:MAG: NADH-quinone oxidoreductase subunit 5 family protein [Candidatus Thorarchaeota archaeon]